MKRKVLPVSGGVLAASSTAKLWHRVLFFFTVNVNANVNTNARAEAVVVPNSSHVTPARELAELVYWLSKRGCLALVANASRKQKL